MSRRILTAAFWADAAERSIKTFAQTLVGVATGATFLDVPSSWAHWLAAAGFAAGLSILTSVASLGQPDSISPASIVPPGL